MREPIVDPHRFDTRYHLPHDGVLVGREHGVLCSVGPFLLLDAESPLSIAAILNDVRNFPRREIDR